MDASESQVHLDIGSEFENIELVQIAVESSLRQMSLGEDDSHWIGMAVREAVANAIQHGNRQDPSKRVKIDFGLEAGQVVIRVADQGEGFVLEAIPDPLAPANLLKPDGRGVFFMRKFMDEIDYTFHPGVGTVVTLRKRIGEPSKDASESEETSG